MYLVFVICLLFLTMIFATLTAALRLFPPLGNLIRAALVALLIVSIRFYYLLLTRLAPTFKTWLHVDVLTGLWRLAATILLSLALGILLSLLLNWSVTAWSVLLMGLHGLLCGLLWDEVLDDGSLKLGVKI